MSQSIRSRPITCPVWVTNSLRPLMMCAAHEALAQANIRHMREKKKDQRHVMTSQVPNQSKPCVSLSTPTCRPTNDASLYFVPIRVNGA